MNIIESIKEDINNELMSALATANTETVEKTKITVETSITSLLLAFMKRASTETGLHLLHSLTNAGNFTLLNPADITFSQDKINKLADEGNALISKIIPDKKSPLITFVSSYSGVRNASANRTNGIITLMVLNKLKQVSAAKSLDLGGLAELFADQKDFLVETAPKNLIEKLSQHIGLGNLISLGSSIITTSASLNTKNEREKNKITEASTRYPNNETQNSNGGFNIKNWIIPLAFGALIIGLIGFYAYNQFTDTDSGEEVATTDSLVNINSTTSADSARNASANSDTNKSSKDTLLVELEEQTLPNGQKLTLEKGNLDYKVFNFLSDTTVESNSKKIVSNSPSFQDTDIELITESSEIYDNIGTIMKAFPQSRLKITVNDYIGSDSTYEVTRTNKKAFAIKKVLLNKSIQPIRVDAVGRLNRTNITDALRAKEVELTIMKK
ncbi:MAG: DUF937 domain-containing protein [Bacteroidota bacterium]